MFFYTNNQTGSQAVAVAPDGSQFWDNSKSIAGSTATVDIQAIGSNNGAFAVGNAPMRFLAPPAGGGTNNSLVAAGSGNVTFINTAGGGDKTFDIVNATGALVNNTTDTIQNFVTGDVFQVLAPGIVAGNVVPAPNPANPATSSELQFSLASGTKFTVIFSDVDFAKLSGLAAAATITPTEYRITA